MLGLFVTMVLPSLEYIVDVRNPSLLMLWTCKEVSGETTCMCVYSCSHVQLKINFEEYDKIKIYISCLSLTPSPEFLKHLEFPE